MNALDTLGYCKRLEKVGVSREQAEVHAQILTEVISQVATKDDLKELEVATKDDLKELEVATKDDLKELEVATTRDLKELEVRLKEWVALYVNEQVAKLKADMVKWLVTVSVAQASLIIAALRYLPH
jgi:hypothetical protein